MSVKRVRVYCQSATSAEAAPPPPSPVFVIRLPELGTSSRQVLRDRREATPNPSAAPATRDDVPRGDAVRFGTRVAHTRCTPESSTGAQVGRQCRAGRVRDPRALWRGRGSSSRRVSRRARGTLERWGPRCPRARRRASVQGKR